MGSRMWYSLMSILKALCRLRGLRSAWRRARQGSQRGVAARSPEPCAQAEGLGPQDPMLPHSTGEAEASPALQPVLPGAGSRSEADQ